jgi:hypothetical protein
VLDEADRLISDEGPAVDPQLLHVLPRDRQLVLSRPRKRMCAGRPSRSSRRTSSRCGRLRRR